MKAGALGRRFVSERSLRLLSSAAAVALLGFGLYFGVEGVRELTRLSM
ncbi:MAG TPA: hypothetical protein VFI22_16915 [Thermomicrobiales bacterium]|nr:hypothetical protein [Thermomicrobiales bacterium]